MWLQNHEREMREDMANKRPLEMTPEDWKNHRGATDCHICKKRLVKELGRTAEEDRRRARADDGPGHALVYRAGDEGRDLDGRQKLGKGKQPAGRRVQSGRANKLHHIP